MAARTWEQDFRYAAIQESIPLIRAGYLDDPFRCPGSFCIPVDKRPAMGLTPGKITLFALVIGFAFLGVGAWMASIAAPQNAGPKAPTNVPLMGAACLSSLAGMACFFVPVKFDRHLIGWLIGDRGRQLIERAGMTQILSAEVSDADHSQMKITIDGDDHVLIFADRDQHRLLIEGTAARYQIRGEDVIKLAEFEFMSYVGIEVQCRVGETRLRLAIARVSLLRELINQLPVLFFLRKRLPNTLYRRNSETLIPSTIEA